MKINDMSYWDYLVYRIVGWRSRTTYWSGSRLANYLNDLAGFERIPETGLTMDGWDKWYADCKQKNPVIYWVTFKFFDFLQNVVMLPSDIHYNLRKYVRNRFINKTHLIETKLEPGLWWDCDSRLLHGIFELVVWYVEMEVARYAEDKTNDKRRDGLSVLDMWINESEMDDHRVFAKELKEIYLWWKDVRPNRTKPDDVFHKLYDNKEHIDRTVFENIAKIEKEYYDEDTVMMKRVIDIRHKLWT